MFVTRRPVETAALQLRSPERLLPMFATCRPVASQVVRTALQGLRQLLPDVFGPPEDEQALEGSRAEPRQRLTGGWQVGRAATSPTRIPFPPPNAFRCVARLHPIRVPP